MKYLYGVYLPGGKWAMRTNKREVIALAQTEKGYVTRMRFPETRYWDAPTFRVCSEIIADFRGKD